MSHSTTKPTKWLCAQRRLRSAWADLSLRWAHWWFCWFYCAAAYFLFYYILLEIPVCKQSTVSANQTPHLAVSHLGLHCMSRSHLWYRNAPKFSDTQVWANSVDPDQTDQEGAVWSRSTLLAIPSVSFGYIHVYITFIAKSFLFSNLWIFTAIFWCRKL